MTIISRYLATALAFAGALPFWILALAPGTVAGLNTTSAFVSYGAIIGSFMAGTLWGRVIPAKNGVMLLLASNFFALVAFVTAIFALSVYSLVAQLVTFGLLLWADHILYAGLPPLRWYWRLRVAVTISVSLAYDVMLLDYVLAAGS